MEQEQEEQDSVESWTAGRQAGAAGRSKAGVRWLGSGSGPLARIRLATSRNASLESRL